MSRFPRPWRVLLGAALTALFLGAARGELPLIYRNAVTLCLSCLGIGR